MILIVLNISILYCFERMVSYHSHLRYLQFGEYGNPPRIMVWIPQLLVWLSIVIVVKLITLSIIVQFLIPIDRLISFIFEYFHTRPQLELVLVMVIIPSVLNAVQFWVTDTFLKRQTDHIPLSTSDTDLDEELTKNVSFSSLFVCHYGWHATYTYLNLYHSTLSEVSCI